MKHLFCALAFGVAPSLAVACGSGETLYFSCTFSGGAKAVEVCHDARQASYSFGRTGQTPELALSHPVEEIELTPWPGVGRTIWEEIVFRNRDHSYIVYAGIDRSPPGDGTEEVEVTVFGGITVRRADDILVKLECDPGSVDFPWGTSLFEAKEAAGQCFDHGARAWAACSSDG